MSNNDNNLNQYETLIDNPEPIDAADPAYEQIFKDLQGGMIKNYGRNYSLYIFIQFDKEKVEDVKQWIRDEAKSVTSTWKQLEQTKIHNERMREQGSNASGELCKNFFLSYQGYKTLGFDPANQKHDEDKLEDTLFTDGMEKDWDNSYRLSDENAKNFDWYNPPESWDIGGCNNIDALILLAHDCLEDIEKEASNIIDKCEEFGKIVGCEVGYVVRDSKDKTTTKPLSIGPFGFADGISQPLFLKSSYDKYCENHSIDLWNPKASLNLVLVKDPFGEPYSYGSYCVWQKLETNLKRFEQKVGELANKLKCDTERASALVIGRFKDGTPLAAFPDIPIQNDGSSIANNFNYADDFVGSKCPIHAHIRKVNPRKHDEKKEPAQRKNRIFRAGITYFDVSDIPKEQQPSDSRLQLSLKIKYLNSLTNQSLEEKRTSISGLLFVCFQRSIKLQFSTIQKEWADDRKFPIQDDDIYLDPVIGNPANNRFQKVPSSPQKWPKEWNKENFANYPFYGFIKNRGGEFFFAPSISFLKKLAIDCINY